MVIIAVLASITIVSYNGITQRANDSVVQNDLQNIAQQFEIYKLDNKVYPTGSSQLQDVGIKVSKSSYGKGFGATNQYNMLYCRLSASGPVEFAMMASSKSGKVFVYKSSTGSITSMAAWYGDGSLENCVGAGINQTNSNDRDILYYNADWQPYVNG